MVEPYAVPAGAPERRANSPRPSTCQLPPGSYFPSSPTYYQRTAVQGGVGAPRSVRTSPHSIPMRVMDAVANAAANSAGAIAMVENASEMRSQSRLSERITKMIAKTAMAPPSAGTDQRGRRRGSGADTPPAWCRSSPSTSSTRAPASRWTHRCGSAPPERGSPWGKGSAEGDGHPWVVSWS